MIEKEICERILTVGPEWKNPKGGIAQVLNTYANVLYAPFHFVPTTKGGNIIKVFIQFIFAIFVFVYKANKCEIVHIHGASYKSFYRKRLFIYIASAFGKKVVFHVHGAEFKKFAENNRKRVSKTLAKCDVLIVLSQSWKDWFEKEFQHPNIIVIKNVIKPPIKQKEFSRTDDKRFYLLFLGVLGPRKGVYDLLEVIKQYRNDFNGKLLLVIGGNGEVEKVKDYIIRNSLENIAQYRGWVNENDKVILLNCVDSLVLPSYNEGLPISIIEAMSYGLPIISTYVGGIPEIVENGENGILIKPGDKERLYQAIQLLMNDVELRKKMGEMSEQKVKDYLPENVEQELSLTYEKLLSTNNI